MDTDRIHFGWRGWTALIGVPVLLVTLILFLRGLDRDRRYEQFTKLHACLIRPVHAERLLPLIATFDPADTADIARIAGILKGMSGGGSPVDQAVLVIRKEDLYYDLSVYSTYSKRFALEGRVYLTDPLEQALDALSPGEQLSLDRIYTLSGRNSEVRSGVRIGEAILTCTASREGNSWD